jgi:hypothetical protein
MRKAIAAWLGQITTIQGIAALVAITALLKLHAISAPLAEGLYPGALALMGLPETPRPIKAAEPLPIQQPIHIDPPTAPASTGPAAARMPVLKFGETP